MNKIKILITCAQDRSAQWTCISLLRAGFEVQLAFPGQSFIKRSNDLLHPDPLKEQELFKLWMVDILQKHPDWYLFPIHEGVMHAACGLVEMDGLHARIIGLDLASTRYSMSKFRATQAAIAAGVEVPKSVFLRAPRQTGFLKLGRDLKYPALVKWDNYNDNETYAKGSNKIVYDQVQLEQLLAELEPVDCGVMAQQLVPGQGVGAFFLRHKGKIVLRFAHRRLHEVPWTGGVSSLCESSNDVEVLEAGERLLNAIDYEGVAMVEFRKEEGKPPVFLEINGRLWGSLGLALAAGADFPRAMVECHMNGETQVKPPDLSRRVRWREPKLEIDYLHSLWEKKPGPCDLPAPRLRGSLSVLWNMIDFRTCGDWSWREAPWGTSRRHLGLIRRAASVIKQLILKKWRGRKPNPQEIQAATRTKKLMAQANIKPPKQVVFLCYGNICRSSYAEYRWNELRADLPELPSCLSAGFHDNVNRRTPARFQSAARHRGVELAEHRSKRVTQHMVDEADWIVLMDLRNLSDFQKEFPLAIEKVVLLGACDEPDDPIIPDPYGQAIGAGGVAYRRIDAALKNLQGAVINVT